MERAIHMTMFGQILWISILFSLYRELMIETWVETLVTSTWILLAYITLFIHTPSNIKMLAVAQNVNIFQQIFSRFKIHMLKDK